MTENRASAAVFISGVVQDTSGGMVAASGVCASFAPNVVNLNNLSAGAMVDFTGTGGSCSDLTFSGATSGPPTISGTVTSVGHAVPGAKVTLAGSTSAFR